MQAIGALLESGQSGLIVVAVNRYGEDVEAMLKHAEKTVVTNTRRAISTPRSKSYRNRPSSPISPCPFPGAGISPGRPIPRPERTEDDMMCLGVRTISLISFGNDDGIEDESGLLSADAVLDVEQISRYADALVALGHTGRRSARARPSTEKSFPVWDMVMAPLLCHPNVNTNASTPGSRNSISKSRSPIGAGWRIS